MRNGIALLLVAFVVTVAALVGGCGGGSTPIVKYDPAFLTPASTPNPPSKVVAQATTADGKWGVIYHEAGNEYEIVNMTTGNWSMDVPAAGKPVALAIFLDNATKNFFFVAIEAGVVNYYNCWGGRHAPNKLADQAGMNYVAVTGAGGKYALSVDGKKVDVEKNIPFFID